MGGGAAALAAAAGEWEEGGGREEDSREARRGSAPLRLGTLAVELWVEDPLRCRWSPWEPGGDANMSPWEP